MHSFASAFIVAALATLTSAAPVVLPDTSLSVPSSVEVSIDAIHLLDVSPIQPEIPQVGPREATPSIAVIFEEILTDIQPYTEQLTYLVSSNLTVTEVTNIVASIKAPIVKAIPEIEALIGLDASVVLAPVTGDVELTVAQIAIIVSKNLQLILNATGHILDVVNAEGGDVVADVKNVLVGLGYTVTGLVGVVVPLVDGLAASLAPLLTSVDVVIADLGLVQLGVDLGLTL